MKNVIVGQSGGPTAVINASLAGVICAAQAAGMGVYGMCHGIEGLIRGDVIRLDLSAEEIRLLRQTPSSYLGSCRYKLPKLETDETVYAQIIAKLKELDAAVFLYIGGNDSMDTIAKLSDYAKANNVTDVAFVGVPKTIDNDLPGTDHCPGFGSAAKYVASCTREVIADSAVYGKPMVTILEIMGRNAGWLTASAALARPDLIYLPENPLDLDELSAQIERVRKDRPSVVIALSEGVENAKGEVYCELAGLNGPTDSFGHRSFTGAGRYVAEQAAARIGGRMRVVEFSVLQRCAAHLASKTDNDEAFECGRVGVQAGLHGENGKMVSIQRKAGIGYEAHYVLVDVHEAANLAKRIPNEWIDNESHQMKTPFLDYVTPLVQGEMDLVFENGLPKHFSLSKKT